MEVGKVIIAVRGIFDMYLELTGTDKPRTRRAMESLFNNKITQDAIDLLRDMGRQHEEYARKSVQNVECLEIAHHYFNLAREMEKNMTKQQ